MAKNKKKDLYLEDYIDDDESIFDLEKTNDFSHNPNYEYDDTYDISDDEDYEVEYDDAGNNSLEVESDDNVNEEYEALDEDLGGDMISTFTLISTWFGRVGIIIAVVLILYFLFTAKFTTMILYVVGLVGAFFFGYLFMYLLERFTSDN